MAKTRRALTFPLVLVLLALAVTLSSARPAFADRYGLAVIVGNGNYANKRVPEVAYAHRDAEAFKRYVLDVLGFDPDRVFDLRDATQAELFTWFGNRDSHEGRLWRYLHPRHGSDVVVFYSGHGVPGLKDRRGYLLPSDADPDTPEINGYPIDLLYTNLGKPAEAKSVRVFLEACFSGESDRGMLVRSASPVYVQASLPEAAGEKLTVLSAASGKEVASWDEKAGHGMFTHHLLDALYGQADTDGDGQVTAAEVKTYLDDTMTIAARVEFGRYQTASLVGPAGTVLARAGTGGAFLARPSLDSPGTFYADLAKEQLAKLESAPTPPRPPTPSSEEVEASLQLNREKRKRVQVGLRTFGFDPGSPDGKFGRNTRKAIQAWQRTNGQAATGYLTKDQAEAILTRTPPTATLQPKCAELPGQHLGEKHAECWEEIENQSGCLLWRTHYHSDQTTTWTGKCRSGIAEGRGVYSVSPGSEHVSYEGTGMLVKGKANGRWVDKFGGGSRYEGEYRDGKRHGQGTLTFASGNQYEGEYRDGKRHGQGTFTFANGSQFEGAYRDGKAHGWGMVTTSSGETFSGEWRDGCVGGQDYAIWMAIGTNSDDCGFK